MTKSNKKMTLGKKFFYVLVYPIMSVFTIYIITLLEGESFSFSEYWPNIVGATIGGCLVIFLLPFPQSREKSTQPLRKKVMANIFFFSLVFAVVITIIVLT